ncbi:type II toxin-antitoxin system PemK/MazF family toxin [Sulfurimonas sp. NW15]|uniref:type II toxin-antitoxin system PemK/MazF family toxin n=1 Tax=Sulfurimonas sp. NW15 TaxID=2922729 RepID=UPI003DA836B1
MKQFDKWNDLKKKIDSKTKKIVTPKEREVYWASIGENIGNEQNGKGDIFSRPVLIVKRFSKSMFFGVPLSTQIKQGSFFYNFRFLDNFSNALIVQGRLYDTKRLENRIGMINKEDFVNIKQKLKDLLDV